MRRPALNHVAGEYSGGLQHCIICGTVICDDRGACSPVGSPGPQGFAPGPIYIDGNMTATGHDPDLADCVPLS